MSVESWLYKLTPRTVFHPVNTRTDGGRSLGGNTLVVGNGGGFWRATVTVPVRGEDQLLAYRAMQSTVLGMASDLLVPCHTRFWRPHDENGVPMPFQTVSGIEGRSLFDHSGFDEPEEPRVFVMEPAPLRSTRMTLIHPGFPPLRAGHYFGIGERLYLIGRAWIIDYERPGTGYQPLDWEPGTPADWLPDDGVDLAWEDGGGTGTVGRNVEVIEFWPPLREAADINTPLILGRPVCKMRPASDDTGVLDMGLGYFGEATLEFEEVL